MFGCSNNKINNKETSVHSAKSTELKTLMHKFDNVIYQHYESELDRDHKRIDYTKDMIGVVDALVADSKRLKKLQPQNLSEKQLQEFGIFAKRLEEKSEELKELVDTYQTEKIAPVITEINNICIDCHVTVR
jgi:hypothetical protein